MSTRCVINFCYPVEEKFEVAAKIYRHCDGYPGDPHEIGSGVLADLKEFFAAVQEQCDKDTRFSDPPYLAAKFVVWQADVYRTGKPLEFLSVGVLMKNPGDIEYEYFVVCANTQPPKVTFKKKRQRRS